MRRVSTVLLALLFGSSLPLAISASTPRLLLHAQAPDRRNPCTPPALKGQLASLQTAAGLYPNRYFVYLLLDNDGNTAKGGASFSVAYDGEQSSGVDITDWHRCAHFDFPEVGWPLPGRGNKVVWNSETNNRTTVLRYGQRDLLVAGYFYCTAYSPDELSISVDPANGSVQVLTPGTVELEVSPPELQGREYATVGFSRDGSLRGFDPLSRESLRASVPSAPAPPSVSVNNRASNIAVKFTIMAKSEIQLRVIDVSGRLVWQSAIKSYDPGEYDLSYPLQGRQLATGIYAYQLNIGDSNYTGKLFLEGR